ncbi:MAG: trigger factor, partial [Anaerolineales bacterium]
RKPYAFVPPDENKVQEALQDLRRMYATTETVDRPIRDGDFVLVDVKGEKAKAKEGEDLSSLSRNSYAVMVREGERDDDWPFPGFPAKLMGMAPGETREFKHKFSKDHADETLAGASVTFTVTVKTVRGMTLPELDDEFAKTVGGGNTLDELMTNLRESLTRQAKAEYDDKYFTELIEDIKAVATLKYPPQVLEHEAEHVLEELKHRLSHQGMDFATYLKMREMDEETFKQQEVMPVAKKRLERSLIIDEVARTQKFEIDEESLKQAFAEDWTNLVMRDENLARDAQKGRVSKDLLNAVMMDSANRLIVERVLDHLKLVATGQFSGEPAAEEAPVKKSRAKKSEAEPAGEAPEAESKPKKKSKKSE